MSATEPYYSIEVNATRPTSNEDFRPFMSLDAVTALPEFDFAFKVDGRAVLEFHNNRDMVIRDEGPQAFMDLCDTANRVKGLDELGIPRLLEAAQKCQETFDAVQVESKRIEREHEGYVDARYRAADIASNEAYEEYRLLVIDMFESPYDLVSRLLPQI